MKEDAKVLPGNLPEEPAPASQGTLGDPQQEYTEVSNNHRHYSALRFASLTLYFAIIGAIASVAFGVVGPSPAIINIQFWAAVAGLLITLAFFLFEILNERNLRHFIEVLRALEPKLGYTQITSRPRHVAMKARHATYPLFVLFVIFWLYALVQFLMPAGGDGGAQNSAPAADGSRRR